MNFKQFTDKYISDYRVEIKSSCDGTHIKLSWVNFEEKMFIDSQEDIYKALDCMANKLEKAMNRHYHPSLMAQLFGKRKSKF